MEKTDIKKFDSDMMWHICEPEEKIKLSAGFYERYEYTWTCIHCEKRHHYIFENLTILSDIQNE